MTSHQDVKRKLQKRMTCRMAGKLAFTLAFSSTIIQDFVKVRLPSAFSEVDAQPCNTIHISFSTGSQFSNNSSDGKNYIKNNFGSDELYVQGGPGCCGTGVSPHGQKLTVVPEVVTKYYNLTHGDLEILPGFNVNISAIPSLYEWTKDAVCQACLRQNPSEEALWLGTAVALSMMRTSRWIWTAATASSYTSGECYLPVMVGPTSAQEAVNIFLVLQYKIIVIGYSLPDFDRSADSQGYPNFFNIIPNHDYPSKAANAVLQELQWFNQLTIIYVNETWSIKLATDIYNLIEAKDSVYMVQVQKEYYSLKGAIQITTRNTDANRTIALIGRTTQKVIFQSVTALQNPVYSLICLLAKTSSFNVRNQNALIILPEQAEDLLVTTERSCYATQASDLSDCDCRVGEMNNVNFKRKSS